MRVACGDVGDDAAGVAGAMTESALPGLKE